MTVRGTFSVSFLVVDVAAYAPVVVSLVPAFSVTITVVGVSQLLNHLLMTIKMSFLETKYDSSCHTFSIFFLVRIKTL